MTGQLGLNTIGSVGLPSTLIRAAPVPNITYPVGVVTTSTVTVTWTYTSPVSRTQQFFRVMLASSGGAQLFDSGIIAGADVSYALGYALDPFATYTVFVGVNDGIDGTLNNIFGSGWDSQQFSTEFEADTVDDNSAVGSVYEIAIDGVGYMLADHPEKEHRYQRRTVHLAPERFATGETPFSESIDRYSFMSHSDWRMGSGQLYRDRPTSDPSRYFYSEWINPFEAGELATLPTPEQHISSTYTGVPGSLAVVASGSVFMVTSATQLTGRDTPTGSNTAFNHGLATTATDLASDGTNWYATDGASIRRNNTAADPAVDWSTVDVTEIEWVGDRLCGIDSATGPNFTSFSSAGVEENVGGIQTFAGATLRGITGGDGFAWFGVNYTQTGHIRAWELGGAVGSTTIALTLPEGEMVDNLYFYLGNVFVASRTEADWVKIYRCVVTEGRLTPQFIVEYDTTVFPTTKISFAGNDRFVAFTWPGHMQRDGTSGIAVYDLESGGYARWYAVGGTGGGFGTGVQSVVRWADDFGVGITSATTGGFYGKDSTPTNAIGFVETSVSDLASNVVKVLSNVSLTTKPLTGSVDVEYSTNTNGTFIDVGTMSGAGVTTVSFDADNVTASSFGFRLTLTPSGSAGPIVKLLAAKTHPLGLRDQLVVVPVDCLDERNGLNGQLIPESGPGYGRAQARTLESLTGRIVRFQDVDWPDEPSADFEVQAVELSENGSVYDRHLGKRGFSAVAAVTLRRELG